MCAATCRGSREHGARPSQAPVQGSTMDPEGLNTTWRETEEIGEEIKAATNIAPGG